MKNKKILISILIAILIIGAIVAVLIFNHKSKTANIDTEKIEITIYENNGISEKSKIEITSKEEIKEFTDYISKLKPLSSKEMVDLELINDIKIKYNDDITVSMQLGEKEYCYYKNKATNTSSLSKIPNGLYELVTKKLNIQK